MSDMSKMTHAKLLEKIAKLEAEKAALAAHNAQKITLKVAKKGGLSIYGLQKFPVTLYAATWKTLFSMAGDIAKFIAAHPELSTGRDDPRYQPGGQYYTEPTASDE